MSNTKLRNRRRLALMVAPILIASIAAAPVHANNYGESYGWQFKTSADRANQAVVLDIMQKQRGGYYRAPNYTTTIERQYNCSLAATSVGNDGSQNAVANSPSVTGPSAAATGNDAQTVLNGRGIAAAGTLQSNSGAVTAAAIGSASANVQGRSDQALNSTQTNSGQQSANIATSSACRFGAAQ